MVKDSKVKAKGRRDTTGQHMLGRTGSGNYMVAGVCALEIPSHLGIHFGRTVGVSSLPQQDTILIIVHCRGIDEPVHSCWRVRAETQAFHVHGRGGSPRDECLIGSCIEQHAFSVYVANVSSIWHRVAGAVVTSRSHSGTCIRVGLWPTVGV